METEADRQGHELREERARLEATLSHDRETSDLADLRVLLDQAATAFTARDASDTVILGLTEHGQSLPTEMILALCRW